MWRLAKEIKAGRYKPSRFAKVLVRLQSARTLRTLLISLYVVVIYLSSIPYKGTFTESNRAFAQIWIHAITIRWQVYWIDCVGTQVVIPCWLNSYPDLEATYRRCRIRKGSGSGLRQRSQTHLSPKVYPICGTWD